MTILVTGGAGFVGTNLIKSLLEKNHIVYSLDDYSTGLHSNEIPGCKYILGDISNINTIWENIDIVYHLAARARIQPSFEHPEEYIRTNFEGTYAIIRYCIKKNIPLIYAGSSSKHNGKFKNPYTFSKDLGEEIIQLYQEHYGLKATITRFYNVYGEKQAYGYEFELGRGKNYSVNEVAQMLNIKPTYQPAKKGEAKITLNTSTLAQKMLGWIPTYNLEDYIKEFKNENNLKMKIIYRISDVGYNKVKPDYINNENCLKNFVNVFGNQNLEIIADNCSKETLEMITKYCHPNKINKVSVGHGAGTFNLALDMALKYDDETIIYFVENDYLHKPNSDKILQEGFELGASFVSLYDHPDKYIDPNQGGNPYCEGGAEDTRVYLTDITSIPGYSTHGETAWLSPLTDWSKV